MPGTHKDAKRHVLAVRKHMAWRGGTTLRNHTCKFTVVPSAAEKHPNDLVLEHVRLQGSPGFGPCWPDTHVGTDKDSGCLACCLATHACKHRIICAFIYFLHPHAFAVQAPFWLPGRQRCPQMTLNLQGDPSDRGELWRVRPHAQGEGRGGQCGQK